MSEATPGAHELESAIPYLLARTGSRLGDAFARALRREGLSLVDWRVCAALARRPDQTLSQLASHVSMDISTLCRLVERLVSRGYVARERSQVDRRALRLSLTSIGLVITSKLVPSARRYERTALRGLTASDVQRLRDMLDRIHFNSRSLP